MPPLREFRDEQLVFYEYPDDSSATSMPELREFEGKLVVAKRNTDRRDHQEFTKDVVELHRQLRTHPCVAEILGVCKEDFYSFLVMEFVEGNSLEQVIMDQNIDFTWTRILSYGIEICKAMQHVHERKVIHRNLKPSNIIVLADPSRADDPRLKLTDFSTARTEADKGMTKGKGDLAYRAPEMMVEKKGTTYDHTVDEYSFGIMFWQVLTRSEPYSGLPPDIKKVCAEQNPLRPPIPEPTPPKLKALLERLWHADPKLRPSFEDAGQVLIEVKKEFDASPSGTFPHLPLTV